MYDDETQSMQLINQNLQDTEEKLVPLTPESDESLPTEKFLDGCHHVYLDIGTNIGIQVRKPFIMYLFIRLITLK